MRNSAQHKPFKKKIPILYLERRNEYTTGLSGSSTLHNCIALASSRDSRRVLGEWRKSLAPLTY
jgi:hypothetical protein